MGNYELELDLQKFIIEYLSLDSNIKLNRSSKLSDCGIDSLDMIEMMFFIEDRYDIVIENTHSIETFGQLLDIIEGKLKI